MFIKYFLNVLVIILTLFVSSGQIYAAESILSMSVRKTTNDALNFTFYTNNDVVDAPIVKDKGNNQYVILLPNMRDASGVKPDLRAVSDVVSNVNVSTISEGAVTYTKVTLLTNKPVNLNVSTRKTTQSAKELTGVNDIIAKVNLINQDIQSSKNVQIASVQVQPVNNYSSVKDVLGAQNNVALKSAVEVKKDVVTKPVNKSVVSVKSVNAHVPSNTKTIKKEVKKLPDENITNMQSVAVGNINKMGENVIASVENNVIVNDESAQVDESVENLDLNLLPMLTPDEGKELKFSMNLWASPFALILFFALCASLIIGFMLNKMKTVLGQDEAFRSAFIGRLNNSVGSVKNDYSKLAQNQNLTWQEKYRSYKSGQVQDQIATLNSYVGADIDDDLDFVEGDIDDPEYVIDDIAEQEQINPFATNRDFLSQAYVVESGDVISAEMRRTLKGFADDKSLHKTKRNVGLKNRFKSFEKNNSTQLQRNIQELLETVIQVDEERGSVEPEPSESVFDVVKSAYEQVRGIEQVKLMPNEEREISSIEIAEPVIQEKRKLKIRESRAIDDNKGFYLVDMHDKMALMGRIDDKFTVLKKFDDMGKKSLQVRRDKDNLFMVRTNGFKALVDVNEDKMGVFAEL